MMKATITIVLSAMSVCLAQRGSYAGRIPYGYPVIDLTTTTTLVPPTAGALGAIGASPGSSGNLVNRLGNDDISPIAITVTTEKIPIEANGDLSLIQRLNQLPIDKQPFWFLNWKALEELRSQPQSYPVNDNGFIDFGSTPNRQNNNIQ